MPVLAFICRVDTGTAKPVTSIKPPNHALQGPVKTRASTPAIGAGERTPATNHTSRGGGARYWEFIQITNEMLELDSAHVIAEADSPSCLRTFPRLMWMSTSCGSSSAATRKCCAASISLPCECSRSRRYKGAQSRNVVARTLILLYAYNWRALLRVANRRLVLGLLRAHLGVMYRVPAVDLPPVWFEARTCAVGEKGEKNRRKCHRRKTGSADVESVQHRLGEADTALVKQTFPAPPAQPRHFSRRHLQLELACAQSVGVQHGILPCLRRRRPDDSTRR